MEAIIKRSSRKSVSIKIDEKGQIFVYCPFKFSLKKINEILESKKEWINKSINRINDKFESKKEFYNYNKLYLLGKEYEIIKKGNYIQIGDWIIKSKSNKSITLWLKKQADKILFERLDAISNFTNLNYNSAKIISARKKWGSCDNFKNINLNFRLVMLPIECIDYVCLHELSHTKFMNHSKNFYNCIQNFMPNYKQIQNYMKNFSFVLELF